MPCHSGSAYINVQQSPAAIPNIKNVTVRHTFKYVECELSDRAGLNETKDADGYPRKKPAD